MTLPGGTVSLLFSDIEGSTALLARLGEAYRDALDGQRRILRRAWSDHGGVEMGTEGDSFFVVFSTAPAAVAAAVQAQRRLAAFDWPGGEQVRVRMGIHTGSPELHDGGYVGMDVHRAARVAAAAHGGQVLISAATAELVGGALPDGAALRDLGAHRLKDLPRREHILQLLVEGLRSEFPPLRALGSASSLPTLPTETVGRDGEIAELTALLGAPRTRLVTLTGPGGTGKTRLAVAIAERLAELFPDGAYFVDLSAATTADSAWAALAASVDVAREAASSTALFEQLRQRHALLVLDNLEQIADIDTMTAELLNEAPLVKVVATSRRPLLLPAEHIHPVPPLELPDVATAAEAVRSGAVQLLVQQARMVRPSFAITDANAADIVAVCRRLDGLPLAIELAAARMRLLTPRALLQRLDQALDIAAAGRTGPERHHTLRETIAWSYELLDPERRRLFCELGVFAGGCDLDGVGAVCSSTGAVEPLDMVAGLVDASLVTVSEDSDGEPRLGMLVTVQAFAAAQLSARDDSDVVRARHLRHFCIRAEETAPRFFGPDSLAARAWFQSEIDNFRTALAWSLRPEAQGGDPDEDGRRLALRLGGATGYVWFPARLREGRNWLERCVATAANEDSVDLVKCLFTLSALCSAQGAHQEGHTYALRAVEVARRVAEPGPLANSLVQLADESVRTEVGGAGELLEEALALARASGDQSILFYCLHTSGTDAYYRGACLDAIRHWDAAAEVADMVGARMNVLEMRASKACALRQMGQPSEALSLLREVVPELVALGSVNVRALAEDTAACLAQLGHHEEAAMLIGAADAMNDQHGVTRSALTEKEIEPALTLPRAALGDEAWQEAYQVGRSMRVPDALMRTTGDAQFTDLLD